MKIYVVNAFITKKDFSGNPAGVCILNNWKPASWMQSVANQMNLSETAFVVKNEDGFSIRYFTPKIEVPLCGHATLASAFILWNEGISIRHEEIVFYANGGTLKITNENDNICMDFPRSKPILTKTFDKKSLEKLKLVPVSIYKSDNDIVYKLDTEKLVTDYQPDFSIIKQLPFRMHIITAKSDKNNLDFISRVFAPTAGIDEDPATGIAHCILGPLWSDKLQKNELNAYQDSARGANFYIKICGDRIKLVGRAKLVLKGDFYG